MESRLHSGHRSRMRNKYKRHGAEFFENYELVEMLLYFSVPRNDTKASAKLLLESSGSFDKLFLKDRTSLVTTNGVGPKSAELIRCIGFAKELIESTGSDEQKPMTYNDFGNYFLERLKSKEKSTVVMLSLDNNLDIMGYDEIYNLDFGSGGVKAAPFIEKAIKNKSSAVVIAHNHPHGIPFPTESDRQSNIYIEDSLAAVGITLAEHYIVANGKFVGFMNHIKNAFSASYELKAFIKSKADFAILAATSLSLSSDNEPSKKADALSERAYLSQLLSYVTKDSDKLSGMLVEKFGSLVNLFHTSFSDIERACGGDERCAHIVRLTSDIYARRITESYKTGKQYSKEEMQKYAKALLFGSGNERVYMIMLGEKERLIGASCVSDGTVNTSGIVPRRLLDVAIENGAESVILAHNHPRGRTTPSDDDILTTGRIAKIFSNSKIKLLWHFVVSGNSVDEICIS